MKALAIILALGALLSGCRDNRMSESFDRDEASADGTGGSGPATTHQQSPDLLEMGAHGSTGADDELLTE